jgi:hypothetical protein
MCSQKKIEANRRNALKSTGPKSADGKARSRLNAMKHGLTAQSPVVLDESPEQVETLAQALHDEFHPQTPMEYVLVQRMVLATWKLQRTTGAEIEAMQVLVRMSQKPTAANVMVNDLGNGTSELDRLQRYEMRLERSLHASMRQLQQLRKNRASLPLPWGEGTGGATR